MKVSPTIRVFVAVAISVAGQLPARALWAENGAIGVRYRAPLDCPSEEAFLAAVQRRNPRIVVTPLPDETQMLVTIAASQSPRYLGRLERISASGAVGVREIGGPSCQEVVTALALITALTGDLIGAGTDAPPAKPPELGAGEAGEQPRAGVDEAPSHPPPDENAPAGGVSPIRWQIGVQAGLALGITPNPLPAAGAFLQLGRRGSTTWTPSARLSVYLAESSWSSNDPNDDAAAQFVWAAASLDGCPLQVGDPLGLSLQPCARMTAGRIYASGSGRPTGSTFEPRMWMDLGGLVRGHWQVARTTFVELDAELFLPLRRYQFVFNDPPDTVYGEPRVGYRFGAAGGLVFR